MSAAVASVPTTTSVQQQPQPQLTSHAKANSGQAKEKTLVTESKSPETSVEKETRGEEARDTKPGSPLPNDLRKLLEEVAKTGACSSLFWNSSDGKEAFAPTSSSSLKARSCSLGSAAARKPQRSFHRRPTPLYATTATTSSAPPRKKHRNGLHVRRFADAKTARKRPLVLVRTSSLASTTSSIFSPGSVGSGRTSGSEPEDSTQYECDSEGTSATSNSEMSLERRDHWRKQAALQTSKPTATLAKEGQPNLQYKSLREAFRTALGLVLDYFFQKRGGYKLSPAEKRRTTSLMGLSDEAALKDETANNSAAKANTAEEEEKKGASVAPEDIFRQRRHRLLNMLGPPPNTAGETAKVSSQSPIDDGPPFTIQRIAEVLIDPERFYTQTHKLCNCLEKLLLVTSSTSAFGGITGGDTSQSRLEERELAALADEKGRLQSEYRQLRLKRRASSSLSDDINAENSESAADSRRANAELETKKEASPEKKAEDSGDSWDDQPGTAGAVGSEDSKSREMVEAAARASLRAKFDHVGIDPHSSAVDNRDLRSIAENRGMTNSPPPPSLAVAAPAIPLPGHGGLLRQHHHSDQDHPASLARTHSPILFNSGSEGSPPGMASIHTNPNMHLLQMHHAAALAGVSPFDLYNLNSENGASPAASPSGITGTLKEADLESRSPASSDVDSESDDVSFDDSASDRSDGSDSGHYEPFSAARAMALNRIQQQQQRSRMLTSLGSHHQSDGFRPPADSEYQSGDSIDSTRAEDSGGSDSSSSDMAD